MANPEMLDKFISSLRNPPDIDKKMGEDASRRGGIKTIIAPRDTNRFSGLGEIIVYTSFAPTPNLDYT